MDARCDALARGALEKRNEALHDGYLLKGTGGFAELLFEGELRESQGSRFEHRST